MMKILDVRGNLVKIESSKPVHISSLLKISDSNNSYIAQVLYTESNNSCHVVFAKLLACPDAPFLPVDVQGVSKDSACEILDVANIIKNLGHTSDIVAGELAYEQGLVTADKELFDKKMLIVSEKDVDSNLLISNFAHQIKHLGYNTIVFDTLGTMDGIKLTAGVDFKLPLNEHAIGFIFNKYFSDITEESRSIVSSIFTELKTYASTVPYIPFKSFKSVIDNVFNYSQNLSLYFFKTKLEKLSDADVFANSHEEVMDWTSLSEFGPGTIIIDLSHVDRLFVSEYISLVLNSFKNTDCKLYAFAKLTDGVSDKDFIREVIESENVITSCIVHSDFRFLQPLKQNCGSIIVFGGIKKPDNFDYCKFILKNMPPDKYILTGNIAAPYSLVFQLKEITEVVPKADDIPAESSLTEEEGSSHPADSDLEINDETPSVEQPEVVPEVFAAEEATVNDENSEEVNSAEISDVEPVNVVPEADVVPEENFDKPLEEQPELPLTGESEPSDSAVEAKYEPVEITDTEELIVNEEIPELSDSTELPVEIEEYEPVTEPEIDNVQVENSQIPIDVTEEEGDVLNTPDIPDYESDENIALTPIDEEPVILETEVPDSAQTETELVDEEPELTLNEPVADAEIEISGDIPELDELELDESERFYEGMPLIEDDTELKLEEEDLLPVEEESINEIDNALNIDSENSTETEESAKTPEELLDEEIRRDVDKVYMAPQHESTDELSEDDLDFIEELVGTEDLVIEEPDAEDTLEVVDTNEDIVQHSDLLPDEPPIPENTAADKSEEDGAILQQRNTATPAVPIYAAEIPDDAIVHSDPIQQGDRVVHVKFGVGVVEKIFSYGTKNFCSINFENIGRKVLDPNITELKKA